MIKESVFYASIDVPEEITHHHILEHTGQRWKIEKEAGRHFVSMMGTEGQLDEWAGRVAQAIEYTQYAFANLAPAAGSGATEPEDEGNPEDESNAGG